MVLHGFFCLNFSMPFAGVLKLFLVFQRFLFQTGTVLFLFAEITKKTLTTQDIENNIKQGETFRLCYYSVY